MNDTKIIVIGAGSIGARHINNISKLGYSNLSVVDKNSLLLNNYRHKFNCYENTLEALEKERPEIAFICTPTSLHLEQTKLALKNNCDVFVEKPLSDNLLGIDQLKQMARGKTVMIGCNWRFNKAFIAFEKTILGEKAGKVLYARIAAGYFLPDARPGTNYKEVYASKKAGGGVLLDSGSHILNYLIALFGEIETIYYLKNGQNYLDIESDEIAQVLSEHDSGVTCDISLDYVSREPINRIEAVCALGTLSLDLVANKLTLANGKGIEVLYGKDGLDSNLMYVDELKHFFECIKKRERPLQTMADAKKVLELILKGAKNNK